MAIVVYRTMETEQKPLSVVDKIILIIIYDLSNIMHLER
jgi:hypothetical protein